MLTINCTFQLQIPGQMDQEAKEKVTETVINNLLRSEKIIEMMEDDGWALISHANC